MQRQASPATATAIGTKKVAPRRLVEAVVRNRARNQKGTKNKSDPLSFFT